MDSSKVSSSIQALNLSSKALNSIKQINSTLEMLDKQLYPFVDNLFDIIVELIYKLKGELLQKEELVTKINEISKNSKMCWDCRCKERRKNIPPKEELEKLIYTTSFVKIGKKYNVSDNSVRKWCKGYGLPFRYGELHKYGA